MEVIRNTEHYGLSNKACEDNKINNFMKESKFPEGC